MDEKIAEDGSSSHNKLGFIVMFLYSAGYIAANLFIKFGFDAPEVSEQTFSSIIDVMLPFILLVGYVVVMVSFMLNRVWVSAFLFLAFTLLFTSYIF